MHPQRTGARNWFEVSRLSQFLSNASSTRRDWIDGTPVVVATTGLERVFPSSAAVSEVCSPCVLFPFFPNVPDVLRQLQNQFSSLDLTYRKGCLGAVSSGDFGWLGLSPGGHPCRFDAECPRVLGPETFADCASYLGRVCRYRTFPPPNPRPLLLSFSAGAMAREPCDPRTPALE